MKGAVKKRLDQMAYTVGVGRHSNEEVDEMFKHDLMMLSELLGKFSIENTYHMKLLGSSRATYGLRR